GAIVQLRAVGAKIVELPVAPEWRDDFPVAAAEGAIAFMFPAECAFAKWSALQSWDQALAGERREIVTMERLGIVGTAELQRGGHEVNHVADFLSQFPPRRNAGRPRGDQRRRNAALVNPHLVLPKRR